MIADCTYPAWEPRRLEDGSTSSSDCGKPGTVAALRENGRPWRIACADHARYYPQAVPLDQVEDE